jgi:hypothetical protein
MCSGCEFGSQTEQLLYVANAVDEADNALLPGLFRVFEIDFHVSPKTLAAAVVGQTILKSLSYPVWGYIADRRPRKPLLRGVRRHGLRRRPP